ncbi:MAG: lamin tail domain-containing protein [Gemmatimonadota bacterium]|nr:lamin tail domain-containing protein [Gemmatimonadota bacterium]
MARLLSFVLLLGFAPLAEATVVISEVLADPPSGLAGDANQDGVRETYGDEFIELYNTGSASVDINGWRLGDSGKSPDTFFQFPANTVIEPGSYVVLFGGGNPTGFTVPVYIDDGRIGNGLTGKGEDIHLIDDTGDTVAVVSHTPWPSKQSLVRHPPDGDEWVAHKTASTIKALFSPGHTHIIPKPDYPLFISEVLADPPTGLAGDANRDGVRDTYGDEFIELYNTGSEPISLAGWKLGDSTAPKNSFQFPADAVIEPGSYVVLFGGGNPTGFTIPVYIDDGKIGNGLTGKGEKILLIDNNGHEIDVISHTPWPSKQSLVRNPPDGGAWVPHKTVSTVKALFSPGHTHIIPKPDYPLFISEVLADPPTGLDGDANRDGVRDTYEDEFIELYNAGTNPISLAGWRLGDSRPSDEHFQFPANAVIAPHSYIVLFGGGNPTGFTIPVYIDDGKIGNGLTGKGEKILLIDNNGHEIDVISHTPWPSKQSLVRNPPDGGAWVPHKTVSTVKALFSPGHTHIIPKPNYPLFISEVLADPPSGLAGDVNRDGQRDGYEDDFIELYNAGSNPISLAGWRLGDSTAPKNFFQFPANAVIAPHSYIVLFGGGKPSGFTVPVYIDDGKIGNGLTSSGEDIRLIDKNGHEIDVVSRDDWPKDQSIVRNPPDGGAWVPHKTASPTQALFSPGHSSATRPILTYPLFISEVLADPPEGPAGDANRDGQYDPHEDEFIELYNAGSVPIPLAGWRLGDAGSLSGYFRFPAKAVIAPRSYVVLFGGGKPLGFTIPVYTDDGTIGDGLTNVGESIHLINDYGDEAASLFHSTWPNAQSLVRTPANEGALVPHKMASPNEAPFSVGHAPETRPILTYPLSISEVLADPPERRIGDANRDGRLDPHEDEFIELYNDGPVPVSLAGWRLGDAGSLSGYFRFPAKAVIAPRSYVVLFGGGNPAEFTVPVYTDDGTIGDGLADSGESIHLINDYGDEVAFLSHSTWPEDQSLARIPPDDGPLVPHKTVSPIEAPFSPGRAPEAQIEPASKTPVVTTATSLQAWPNPFNATTHLGFHLHQTAFVHVAIYNVQGQRVRTLMDAPLNAGVHQVQWDSRDDRGHSAATGPYFVRFRTEHSPSRYAKLLLLR